MSSMTKLIGAAGATFEVVDTAGVASIQLDGNDVVTPVQQAAVTAPTGGATVDAEARTAINALIARLQGAGIIA